MTDFSIARDYWDRPYITQNNEPLHYVSGRKSPANAEPYTRISTLAGMLDSKDGLLDYVAARAMLGMAKSKAISARVSHLASAYEDAWRTPEGKKPLKELVAKAKQVGGGDDAADRGTAAHGLWELRDGGKDVGWIPDDLYPWTIAREEALKDFEPVLIEPFIVCDGLKVAGSPDRYWRHKPTGVVYAADDKTGDEEWKYPLKVTVQVAIASRGVLFDQKTGERTPIECSQDWGILVHTPINTAEPRCDLYWLDLRAGWERAVLAAQVRDKRNLPKLEKIK